LLARYSTSVSLYIGGRKNVKISCEIGTGNRSGKTERIVLARQTRKMVKPGPRELTTMSQQDDIEKLQRERGKKLL